MRHILFIVLCTVFSADLVIGVVSNVVLHCPCQLESTCFKPLDISKVNETRCADEHFVRCCSESEAHVTQIVVISSTTSTEPKHSGNVSVVFPSEMSGIPQTTPSNMSDDYMVQMIDQQSGNQMLLVFPKHEETTTEASTTTTTSTPPPSTTTTQKLIESPITPPTKTTAIPEHQNPTPKPKPTGISGKRRKIIRNKSNHGSGSEQMQRHEIPKPNSKIYDVSRRKNFLRRHPDTPQEIFDSIPSTTTQIPVLIFDEKLQIKVDQEHKAMIENLKALLTANANSLVHRPRGKTQQVKSFEGLINHEMEKAVDSMKKKPYRGKIKYKDYKWAAIPDIHQEQHRPAKMRTRTTKRPTTTTPQPTYNFPSIPHNEFVNGKTVFADFKPSPLWSIQAENVEVSKVNTRHPQRTPQSKFDHFGAENGFAPAVHNGEPLQIVGPVPQGFKPRIDDSLLSYELPDQAITNF